MLPYLLPLSLFFNLVFLVVVYYGNLQFEYLEKKLDETVIGSSNFRGPVTTTEPITDTSYISMLSTPKKVNPWNHVAPFEDYATSSNPHTASNSTNGSLFVNLRWDVGNGQGGLRLPSDPKKRYQLIVDVGLEQGSGFMILQPTEPDLVILGFEGHPINFGVSYHNMHREQKLVYRQWLEFNQTTGRSKNVSVTTPYHVDHSRILVMPLACSNYDGYVEFNENYVPACGSILKSKKKGWWCTVTTRTIPVPVTRLDTMLKKVPHNYDFFYLKVDTEGADALVIEGAGEYLEKFKMVSVECRAPDDIAGEASRENNCNREQMLVVMKNAGFVAQLCKKEDCHFAKTDEYLQQTINLFEVRAFNVPTFWPISKTFDLTQIELYNLTKLKY